MKKKKIVLATVNSKKDIYSFTADEFAALAPNIHLGLLHSYLKSKGIDVEIIEADVDMVSMNKMIGILKEKDPLLFGVICSGVNPSSSTMTMAGVVDFFEFYNKSDLGIKSFIWGGHPTVLPERSLIETGADFIVRGEGFEAIEKLYDALCHDKSLDGVPSLSYFGSDKDGEKALLQNSDAALIEDLDTLPQIDWELMNPARYRAHNWHCFGDINQRSPYAILWTSFGCPYKCSYCSTNNLFGKRGQRFRTIDNVMDELTLLVEKYNVKHLKILDELFVSHRKRMEEFCDKLEKKGYDLNIWAYSRVDSVDRDILKRLKKVGVNWLAYGFESSEDEILKEVEKDNHKASVSEVIRMTQEEGISICAGVMFGLPNETMETMQRTYDFIVRHNFEWVNMYPVFAQPGTKLYEKISEPKDWKGYALYGYDCDPMSTKYLSAARILQFRDECFVKYHSRPEYLSMIEKKFGVEAKDHILRMLQKPLKRRLIEEAAAELKKAEVA